MLPFDVKPCRPGIDCNLTSIELGNLHTNQPLLTETQPTPISSQPKPSSKKTISSILNTLIKTNPNVVKLEKETEEAIDMIDRDIEKNLAKNPKKIHPLKHACWSCLHYTLLGSKYTILIILLILVIFSGFLTFSKEMPAFLNYIKCMKDPNSCDQHLTQLKERNLPNITQPYIPDTQPLENDKILSDYTIEALQSNEWPSAVNLKTNEKPQTLPNDGPIGFKNSKPIIPYHLQLKELIKLVN